MSFAAVLFISCTREIEMPEVIPASEHQMREVILAASVESDSETRTVLRNGKIYWQYGDQISLFYGIGAQGGYKFTNITAGESLTSQFSGMIDAIEGGSENATDTGEKQFIGVYPYRDDIACDGSTVTTTLPDVQTAVEGSFDRNLFISMGRSSGLTMKFYNVCGGIVFSVSHPHIFQIEFSGNAGEVLAGQVKVGFDADGKPEVKQILDGKTKITVNAPDGGEFEVGKTYCLVTLPVQMSASMKMAFVKTDATSGLRKWQKTDIKFERNELKTYYPIDADQYTTFFDAVDLGGSVLWATVNVGATEVGEYGEYYNWGETTPFVGNNLDSDIKSKYQNHPLTQLDPEDDAATMNWGGYWRMPTSSELEELQSLVNTNDNVNSISGRRFTANNGSGDCIFIPYAGEKGQNNEVQSSGLIAVLWSSSLHGALPYIRKYVFRQDNSSNYIASGPQANGYSVRPVLSKPIVATSVVLDKTSLRMNMSTSEQLTATVLPDNAFRKGVTWSSSNTQVASVDASGKVTATGVGTATITATSVMTSGASASCEVTVIESQSLQSVEMGPNQIWATCNIGAELPTDAGTLFAWGETQPKETYTWVNYRWLTPNYITKYQAPDNNWSAIWYGEVDSALAFIGDGKTILDPEDDAAIANWNNEWHTPTRTEWEWLLNNSNYETTTENGVPGVRFTSTVSGYTQNSIFLPYGIDGGYWSSSLRREKTETAHKLSIANGSNGVTTMFFNERRYGYMIRPVHSPLVRVTGVSLNMDELIIRPPMNSTYTLTATISPANSSEKELIWTSSDPSVATVSSSGVIEPLFTGTTTITVTTVDGNKTASCIVDVAWTGTLQGHDWVDMGDGVKWATMNIGASSETDYGYYFAFGETSPKSEYSDETYTYQYSGLNEQSDAAFVNWGNSWHIPDNENWNWLIDSQNCTNAYVTDYKGSGKNGRLFTSIINGSKLFLPAAGYMYGTGLNHAGEWGKYWSSSACYDSDKTYEFEFQTVYSPGIDQFGYRSNGYSIRPVSD